MDELALLRTARDDVTPLDAETAARAHALLLDAFTSDTSGAPRMPPRAARWTIGLTLAAAACTGTFVVVNVLGGPGGADRAAAETLDQAAFAAIHSTDPTVGPGQYLTIRTESVYADFNTDAAGHFIAYLTRGEDTLSIPGDQSGTWVWNRSARTPFRYFGAAAKSQAESDLKAGYDSIDVGIQRAAGGAFYGSAPEYTPVQLAALPRDPQTLLNHIYDIDGDRGQSRDGEALTTIADMLRTGLPTASLRAALYKAAALIPGVTITAHKATLDGSTGVAVGRIEPSTGIRQDIIINPATGLLIGEQEVTTHAVSGLPAETVMESTSVTTTVTNSAP